MNRFGAPLVVLLLLVPTHRAWSATAELEHLLGLPISPGSVAALVAHAADPAAQARLGEALRDARPEVRLAAARVAFVTRSTLLVPQVAGALASERDDGVAAEMMRIVATFDPAKHLELLRAMARTHGPDVARALTESLARTHQDLLATYVRTEPQGDAVSPVGALVLASVQHPQDRPALGRAALAAGGPVLRRYLLQMHEHMVPVDAALVEEALASSDTDVRVAAARYVATLAGHPADALDRSLVEAVARGADGRDAATWEGAYGELARRALGREPRPIDWERLFSPVLPVKRWSLVEGINATLYGPERADVEKLVGGPLSGDEYFRSAAAADHPESRAHRTRTLTAPVARVFPDLMAVFGCKPGGSDAYAVAEVFYGPEGRPRVVRPAGSRLSEGCTAAAHTAFQLTIAPADFVIRLEASDGVYLPFLREYLACIQQPSEYEPTVPDGAAPTPARVKGRWDIGYPKSLKPLAIRGTVRVSAEVTSHGCARAAGTTSSLHPLLDVEALRAVLQMPYEPSMLDGKPVLSRLEASWTFRP